MCIRDSTYIDFDTGLVPNAADPGMEWEVVVTSSSGAQASGGYALSLIHI